MNQETNPQPALNARQRQKLDAAIKAEIRKYERCRKALHRVDAQIYQAGIDLFESEAGLALWLCAPARALGGRVPLTAMRTAKGQKEVAGILHAIAHGVYL